MPTVGEVLFADTNVFLSATDRSRSQHEAARDLLIEAGDGRFQLALSGQVVREYLVVATRPVDANGLGLETQEALRNVQVFTSAPFIFCDEPEAVSHRLRDLTAARELTGRRIHDANIAATMLVHGIPRLVTQNTRDFVELKEIEVCDLHEV